MHAPDAVVFQSGADSLTGDRLGCFNLSIRGHAECLKSAADVQRALLVLGGGGYTPATSPGAGRTRLAACSDTSWRKMPVNDYSEYFGPTHTADSAPNMENQNTPSTLRSAQPHPGEPLQDLAQPSVPFHDVPLDAVTQEQMEIKEDPDQKGWPEAEGARRAHPDGIEPDEGDRDDKPSRIRRPGG